MFDTFVVVDWSAANQPKTGRDSIWICAVDRGGTERMIENPPTRHAAKNLLRRLLVRASERGERLLVGFDFPFGYPAGFATGLGLSGPPWRAIWDEIARLLHDQENNKNNRFGVAAQFNERISGDPFPFWGCPASKSGPFLQPKFHRAHDGASLAERRLIDCWMRGAQPCWKLAYTGSVGSQALTGIPVVRELRDDPRWVDRARVWPFETQLAPPDEAQIVFAEVWPSWWQVRREFGPPIDKAQVRTVAEIFARCDQAGELAGWFRGDPHLSAAQRRFVETEEAWTLGVTAARQRRVSAPPSTLHPSPGTPAVVGGRPVALSAGGESAWSGPDPGEGPAAPRFTSGFSCDGPSLAQPGGAEESEGQHRVVPHYRYLRDPAAISRRSLALVRAEADLARFSGPLRRIALRIAHAAGDVAILDALAASAKAAAAGAAALKAGAPILVDVAMVAAGISGERLTAANEILCFLHDPAVPSTAASQRTTRSAAAVELWRPYLAGAVVAIGNAPTALFRLLEILAEGAAKPAVILGFPVGFVGAAEAKAALAAFGNGLEFVTLYGRRGGSAIAAAAVNALAASPRITRAIAR
jgi:precorrin-8X/cobalt-precorrin-8 methylmutase